MKHFMCTNCASRVFFANDKCLNCGFSVGFDPASISMLALEPAGPGTDAFLAVKSDQTRLLRYCDNAQHEACNWLTADWRVEPLCLGCELNDVIPDLTQPGNLQAWQKLELAKKRLIYSLLRFDLPLDATRQNKGKLTFNFVRGGLTGHLDGVITINIKEADAVERERRRQHFDEPYRSLLGHLRHESGHFYWNILVQDSERLQAFRSLFGDERADYGKALERHHAVGPPGDWQDRFVSAYASAHPWEDWAESWAHYVHIVDAIETAETEGIEPRAAGIGFGASWPFEPYDAYRAASFDSLRDRWVPLTIALNRMNRSFGHDDFYGFATAATAYDKLRFIHDAVRGGFRHL